MSGKLPPEFLDRLRQHVTLSALIISSGTPLKRAGNEWKACCPFHNEKSPSFTVNDSKGFYHCFGCGAHGDVIRWLTEKCGTPFIDAVKQLAEGAGIPMPERDPRTMERERRAAGAKDVMEAVASAFHAGLRHNANAMNYLRTRGIGPNLIAEFKLGYSLPIERSLQGQTVSAKLLDDLGLRRTREGRTYDFFRDRLMIPIHDNRGKVIAFGGRVLDPAQSPKYLNSPDSPVFHKGHTLFNFHRAAPEARARNRLLVVEGYMDVIGLASVGVLNVSAPNGTAMTETQFTLGWRLADELVLIFDGDKAGRRAAFRAAHTVLPALQSGKTVRFAFPPEGKDPDDLAREGGLDAINALCDSSISLIDVLWQELLGERDMRDPDARAAVMTGYRELTKQIKDVDVRAAYSSEFTRRVNDTLRRAEQAPRKAAPAAPAGRYSWSLKDQTEASIVLGLMMFPDVFNRIFEALLSAKFTDDESGRIVETFCLATAEGSMTDELAAQLIERHNFRPHLLNLKSKLRLRLPYLRADYPKAREELYGAMRHYFGAP